jgi:hypothetical protein
MGMGLNASGAVGTPSGLALLYQAFLHNPNDLWNGDILDDVRYLWAADGPLFHSAKLMKSRDDTANERSSARVRRRAHSVTRGREDKSHGRILQPACRSPTLQTQRDCAIADHSSNEISEFGMEI